MKIGEKVIITNTGCIYPTYESMAKKLGADFDKWKSNRMSSIEGKHAEILNINMDRRGSPSCHILIEMIEGKNIGEQYVIGMDGVKVDVAYIILEDDLFEI